MSWRWGLASRIPVAVLVATAIAFAAVFVSAWSVREEVPVAVEPMEFQLPTLMERTPSTEWAALLAAVGKAPFRPDRQLPAGRYLLPAERRAAMAAANRPPPRAMQLSLVGTVEVPSGGSFAALQLPGGPARLYRVGQTIEGFELVEVTPGAVKLAGEDTTIVLLLAKPGERRRGR